MSMNHKLRILTDKFTDDEKYFILAKYPFKEEDLTFYNDANYFQVHKLYYQGFFMGYVVLFLGHNSLDNNDALIEDIGYLRGEELLKPLMYTMLERIKKHKVLSFPFKQLYYDVDKFDEIYLDIFEALNLQKIKRNPCRA